MRCVTLFALLLASMFIAGTARAQNCAPREIVVTGLAEAFGETRRGVGLGGTETQMELWASEETGSWSITVTSPAGITCLIAAGQNYEQIDEARAPGDRM